MIIGRSIAVALGALGLAAHAQPPPGEVERALLQRQHYQDELSLKLRQSQEQLDPALSPSQRLEMGQRHLRERQRQGQLHEGQLRRQQELQQTLPQLPARQQQIELQRQGAEFARERAEQFDP